MRPVMNEHRPAVQLACPYQLVKYVPSFARRSTFGVGCPSVAPPPLMYPKSDQPVSSVIRMTTLGFLSAACAETAASAAISGTAHCVSIFSFIVCSVVRVSLGFFLFAFWFRVLFSSEPLIFAAFKFSSPVARRLSERRRAARSREKVCAGRPRSRRLWPGLVFSIRHAQ